MFRKSIRGNKFLVLDIGTEAVKALVFKQEARKKEGNFLFFQLFLQEGSRLN